MSDPPEIFLFKQELTMSLVVACMAVQLVDILVKRGVSMKQIY